jgi:hypothetical protein
VRKPPAPQSRWLCQIILKSAWQNLSTGSRARGMSLSMGKTPVRCMNLADYGLCGQGAEPVRQDEPDPGCNLDMLGSFLEHA